MTTASTRAVCAERTVTLTRPHPLNPLRRLLRRPVPTYTAHLFADAVVYAADEPQLALEVDGHRVRVVFTWPGTVGGVTTRLSVRERGADRFLSGVEEDHQFPAREVQAWVAAGRITPNDARRVLAGEVSLAEAFSARCAVAMENDAAAAGPVDVALPRRMAAMFAEGVMPSPLPGAPTPPTESTTVLHDLAFIVDQLETAQFQVALSPGGADEGSVDNAAHLALCAVQMMQAKLEVVAVAADEAVAELHNAQARLEPRADNEPMKRCLNRSRSSLRFITDRLPHTHKDSAHAPV